MTAAHAKNSYSPQMAKTAPARLLDHTCVIDASPVLCYLYKSFSSAMLMATSVSLRFSLHGLSYLCWFQTFRFDHIENHMLNLM